MLQTTESPKKSNREAKLLETRPTSTKETKGHRSNREENPVFKIHFNALATPAPLSRNAHQNPAIAKKKRTNHPHILFRVELHPVVCFQEFTNDFN
jgi:hypothetical protein